LNRGGRSSRPENGPIGGKEKKMKRKQRGDNYSQRLSVFGDDKGSKQQGERDGDSVGNWAGEGGKNLENSRELRGGRGEKDAVKTVT